MFSAAELLSRFPAPSHVDAHAECLRCDAFAAWLTGMHAGSAPGFLEPPLRSAPTWLCNHFTWGPSKWPVYLCDLVAAGEADCGVFASLFSRLLLAEGVPHLRAQLVLTCTLQETVSWSRLWLDGEADNRWVLTDRLAFHEAIGFVAEGQLQLLDSTDMKVIDLDDPEPVTQVAAMRLLSVDSITDPATAAALVTTPLDIWLRRSEPGWEPLS